MPPSFTELLPRSGRLLLRVGAQAVPAAGVFGFAWPPTSGLILYWIESVLVLGATLLILTLFARRSRGPERPSDLAAPAAAGIRPRDMLIFQGGALGIFGLFFGGLLFILVSNGFIESAGLREAMAGVPTLAAFIACGLLVDLVRLRRLTAADMQARANAGDRRFAIFWVVGFFGVLGGAFLGKPLLLFGLFAGVKTLFEIGAVLERTSAPL